MLRYYVLLAFAVLFSGTASATLVTLSFFATNGGPSNTYFQQPIAPGQKLVDLEFDATQCFMFFNCADGFTQTTLRTQISPFQMRLTDINLYNYGSPPGATAQAAIQPFSYYGGFFRDYKFNDSPFSLDEGRLELLNFYLPDPFSPNIIFPSVSNLNALLSGTPGQDIFSISRGPYGSFFYNGDWTYSINAVPVPAAVWLFGTAFVGLLGFSKRRKVV